MIFVINRIVFITARLLVLLFAALAFVVVAALAAVQFQPIRGWGVYNALSIVNESLEGKIYVGEITGNLISGATLYNVSLVTAGDTLVQARRVVLRYQLSPFFRSKVIGAEVTIDEPNLRLIRSTDSSWNFEHIARPSTTVDTTTSRFPYTIEATSLELRGGHLEMRDMTQTPGADTSAFEPSRISVRDFYMSAEARMADRSYVLRLHNLAGYLERPSLHLIQLAGDFSLDTLGARAERVRIETDRTLLDLSAHAEDVNIFGKDPVDWGRVPLRVGLAAGAVSTEDLQRFVPSLRFMAGAPALRLQAHGTLADLSVDTLDLVIKRTNLHLRGRLRNLDESRALTIEGRIANSLIDPDEVRTTLPGIPLGNLPATGDVRLASAAFAGTPERFNASIDALTDAGAARGGVMLDLSGPTERYEADLAVARLDLGELLRDRSLASNINGRLLTTGVGFNPSSLSTRFLLDARDSRIMDRKVRRLVARGVYTQGGMIRVDTLVAAPGGTGAGTGEDLLDEAPPSIDAFVRSSGARERMNIALPSIPEPILGLSGTLDIRRQDDIQYDLRGRVDRMSMADLVPGGSTDKFRGALTVKGHGIDPDKLEAHADVVLEQAELASGTISNQRIRVDVKDTVGGRRSLVVDAENAVYISVQGFWTIDGLIAASDVGVQGLVNDILRAAGQSSTPPSRRAVRIPRTEATYVVRVTDMDPIEPFLSGIDLEGRVDLSGEVSSSDGRTMQVSANGTLTDIDFRQSKGKSDSISVRIPKTLDLRLMAHSDAVGVSNPVIDELLIKSDTTVYYNGTSIDRPTLTATLQDQQLHLSALTGINGEIVAQVHGVIGLGSSEGFDVDLDTLKVFLPNNNRITSVGPLRALVHPDHIRIDTLALQFNDMGVVRAHGSLLNSSTFDSLVVSVSTEGRLLRYQDAVTQLRTAEIRISGTMEKPVVDLDLALDSLYYGQVPVGHLRSRIHYEDLNASGQTLVFPVTLKPEGNTMRAKDSVLASVQINSVPLDLALASREERILTDRPFDIKVSADSLPVTIASPFVPNVKLLSGGVKTLIAVGGKYPDLRFNGNADLKNVLFRVEANNLVYSAEGQVEFADTTLRVRKLDIRNDPRDLPNGLVKIGGYLGMSSGFIPGRYTVTVESDQIMLLSDASQASGNGLYGDLIIGMPVLKASGTLEHPVISGNITVIGANLKYDQSSTTTTVNSATYVDMEEWNRRFTDLIGPSFPVEDTTVQDSTHRDTLTPAQRDTLSQAEKLYLWIQQKNNAQGGTPVGPVNPTDPTAQPVDPSNLLEIQNLGIRIAGTTTFTINFSLIQSLRAVLKTAGSGLVLKKEMGGEMTLEGNVDVVEGSKFTYLKGFDALGVLEFQGPIGEPKMSITANYNARRLRADQTTLEPYQVRINLTGTPSRPTLDLSYTINGVEPAETDPERRQRNALALLLYGRLEDEVGGLGAGIGDALGSAVDAGAGTVASQLLSAILAGNIDFIKSVELDLSGTGVGLGGNELDRARLSVVTQIGQVVARFGGNIKDPGKDGIITIDLPLNVVTNLPILRDMLVQLSSIFNSSTNSSSLNNESVVNFRVRLPYRHTW